jgi:hypothetical protein
MFWCIDSAGTLSMGYFSLIKGSILSDEQSFFFILLKE